MKHVVMTGGTGSFGRLLVKKLLGDDVSLTLLVRAHSRNEAEQKVLGVFPGISSISLFPVDLSHPTLGLSENVRYDLCAKTTHILHAAASTRFTLSLPEARLFNLIPTEKLLAFAQACPNLIKFGHVSTAYIAGKRRGRIDEDELIHEQGFLNSYQESKYEAEIAIDEARGRIPVSVYRPSLLLAAERLGQRSALSYCIDLAVKGFLPILPGSPDSMLDLLTGDSAAEAIASIFLKAGRGKTYHIASGNQALRIKSIISSLEKRLGYAVSPRFAGDYEDYQKEVERVTKYKPHLKLIYKKLHTFLPELCFPKTFDTTHLIQALPTWQADDPRDLLTHV